MNTLSILFPPEMSPTDEGTASEPPCFHNLHLDQVLTAVLARREAYRLTLPWRTNASPKARPSSPTTSPSPLTGAERVLLATDPNQGGKTTFLRSVGLAQLLLHAGLPVPAASMETSIAPGGVFTHFKREEDDALESGKLDEELGRMDAIADHLTPHSMVLFNESFASTNEREGSEIAFQVIQALRENRVRGFFVTHFYALAHRYATQDTSRATLFLRAERLPDGRRTFKIRPGAPEKTSFGEDVYRQVFGKEQAGQT